MIAGDAHRNTGHSLWTSANSFLLKESPSTGTDCPGRWWGLHSWRLSNLDWTWSWATFCRWPCMSRVVGLRKLPDAPSSLSQSLILWFASHSSYIFPHWKYSISKGCKNLPFWPEVVSELTFGVKITGLHIKREKNPISFYGALVIIFPLFESPIVGQLDEIPSSLRPVRILLIVSMRFQDIILCD